MLPCLTKTPTKDAYTTRVSCMLRVKFHVVKSILMFKNTQKNRQALRKQSDSQIADKYPIE